MVLVPFPGFLYLYMLVELLRIAVSTFSSPSRGSYISTFTLLSFASYTKFSSPSRGSYISTRMGTVRYAMPAYVLVPFPGFLYLYLSVPTTKQELEFSSPSRGSYISTLLTLNKTIHGFSSRPLPGVLISLLSRKDLLHITHLFSSPSRGSYISTIHIMNREKLESMFSSPSRGSYISTNAMKVIIENNRFSSPSRGSYISTKKHLRRLRT